MIPQRPAASGPHTFLSAVLPGTFFPCPTPPPPPPVYVSLVVGTQPRGPLQEASLTPAPHPMVQPLCPPAQVPSVTASILLSTPRLGTDSLLSWQAEEGRDQYLSPSPRPGTEEVLRGHQAKEGTEASSGRQSVKRHHK